MFHHVFIKIKHRFGAEALCSNTMYAHDDDNDVTIVGKFTVYLLSVAVCVCAHM